MEQLMVGVDWGHKHVQFAVEDDQGKLLWKARVEAKADAIDGVVGRLRDLAAAQGVLQVTLALEQKASRLIETFLSAGFEVWFAPPDQVDTARELRFHSKAKDDLRDARVMGWMLRTMREGLTRIEPASPLGTELRRLTRTRASVVALRTSARNRITELLRAGFPELLELGKPDVAWFTALWRLVRTPQRARTTRLDQIEKVLAKHGARTVSAEQVQQTLQKATTYEGAGDWAPVAEIWFDQLELLERQIHRLDRDIAKKLAACSEAQRPELPKDAPTDAEIVRSLPGVGATLTAVLLAEQLPELLRADLDVARAITGVAPVLKVTGEQQTRHQGQISMRRACSVHLRNALHLAVEKALPHDDWVAGRYAELKARNHTHARACRHIADRLLHRLRAMLRDRTLYRGAGQDRGVKPSVEGSEPRSEKAGHTPAPAPNGGRRPRPGRAAPAPVATR